MSQRRTPHRHIMFAIALLLGVGLFAPEATAQWTRASLPAPYSTGYYLDIMFLEADPNLGWACSLEGYVVRTTDAGQTWAGVRVTSGPIDADPDLEHIQFLTPLIGYVSGPSGIFRSIDGGATWRDVTPFGISQDLGWGCYFLNQNEGVYLVGGCSTGSQQFYKTTDGGFSWNLYITNEPLSGLSDAILYRDGSGFAVSSGVLWQTQDYGRSWFFYSRTGEKFWTEELAISGRSFLLPTAGADCFGSPANIGSIRYSTDVGRTFREFQTGAAMFGSFLLDEQTGWAVGNNRSVYYTTNAGETWTLRNCGIVGDVDDVWFVSDTLGWIAGNGLYKSNFNAIRRAVTLTPAEPALDMCANDSIYVEASDGFDSYIWEDGTVGQGRFIRDSGLFVVVAYDEATCLESRDTLQVRLYPSIIPGIGSSNREICEGDSVEIEVFGPFTSRTWSNGDLGNKTVVRQSGVFTVTTVDSNGCVREASIEVVVHPNPDPQIASNRSTTICLDETVTLSAPPGFVSYLWTNGSTDESIAVSTGGDYSVTVIDSNGCIGTAEIVTVIVLETRNKVYVDLSSTGGVLTIPSHPVGEKACVLVTITNQSEDEILTISNPLLFGNVFFSIPLSQLPIRIDPLASSAVQICAAAIDSGMVFDTLMIPDTCSPTIIPVQSRGETILYEGTSRCEVPAITTVYSAGTTHHLSAPFPMPANNFIELQVSPVSPVRASIIDAMGRKVVQGAVVAEAEFVRLQFITENLAPGPYMIVIEIENTPIQSFPATIVR